MTDNRTTVDGRPPVPATEPVRTRTRTPLAIGAAVVALLVVLVARPWDSHVPATPPGVSATALPAAVAPEPPMTLAPTDAATAAPTRALPTPDIGPPGPVGEFSLGAAPDGSTASCRYARQRRGVRQLSAMEVLPPLVRLENRRSEIRDIRHISWYFEVEMVRQEALFDSEWETVGRSRRQGAPAVSGRFAAFQPLRVEIDARSRSRTAVYRARVVIEWYTRNLELAGRVELIPHGYAQATSRRGSKTGLYCPAVAAT